MSQVKYKIIGRSGAGSLIAEFLLSEIGVTYEILFTEQEDLKNDPASLTHPLGKIPTLICSDESLIFETLAIVNHITDRFNKLAPERNTPLYDRYTQFLSLMATAIYPAYHRQHHSHYYINSESINDLRLRAHTELQTIYDYIESELSPFVCGDILTAADFYLYMLLRWDLHKEILYHGRPKLRSLSEALRKRRSVIKVLDGQPKKRSKSYDKRLS